MTHLEREMAAWKWLGVAFTIIVVLLIIVCYGEAILDVFEVAFYVPPCPGKSPERNRKRKEHRRKVRKWKRSIKAITKARIAWETRSSLRDAGKRSRDMAAETLATHQEIMEALYGEDAPTPREIAETVTSRYGSG